MKLKIWFYRLYDKGRNYNLFMVDDERYDHDSVNEDENENQEREDSQTILKYQKYMTRLYIVLLLGINSPLII